MSTDEQKKSINHQKLNTTEDRISTPYFDYVYPSSKTSSIAEALYRPAPENAPFGNME